jgi:hypothetical protein
MRRNALFASVLVLVTAGAALGQTVTATLESTQNGQTVAPGTAIDWIIKVTVSTGDNLGLAAIACDLVQDSGNPEKIDIPPGDPNSVDATMQQFSRPAGISNPGETYPASGYTGVQRGGVGFKDVVQIGGAQNTFGEAGSTMGQDYTVQQGIGQSGPQVIASGKFDAPATEGGYTFRLDNVLANVLVTVGTPPEHSTVVPATTDASGAEFTFTVQIGPVICRGDTNCDNQIDFFDVNSFVDALVKEIYCDGTGDNADINGDGTPDFFDINPFVEMLTDNTLPLPCP